MKDNLWHTVFTEYKKHGNSLNGAQLITIEQNLREMQKNYTDEEISDMLKNDFDFYHYVSGHLRSLPYSELITGGEDNEKI